MTSEGDRNAISAEGEGVMSTEQMRQQAESWKLAQDAELRKHLEGFAKRLECKSQELHAILTRLDRRIDATNTSLGILLIMKTNISRGIMKNYSICHFN